MEYGYARVSTNDQDSIPTGGVLKNAGCQTDRINRVLQRGSLAEAIVGATRGKNVFVLAYCIGNMVAKTGPLSNPYGYELLINQDEHSRLSVVVLPYFAASMISKNSLYKGFFIVTFRRLSRKVCTLGFRMYGPRDNTLAIGTTSLV